VAYRVLAANQHPDHDTIAAFRKRHLKALSGLFVQVLLLCQGAGLVKLGHVALDGTKVKANASKHKAMSYQRMCETEKKLQEEVDRLVANADTEDAAEDAKFGEGHGGDDWPAERARREGRLAKIREAKAVLEQHAREQAVREAELQSTKIEARERKERDAGKRLPGGRPKPPQDPDKAVPDPKAPRNFTDPESRIMVDGATKGFVQGYNAQAVVDAEAQIIVAADVTQQPNDKKPLLPMLEKVKKNLGQLPEKVSADSGYFSEQNVTAERLDGVDLSIPPHRQKHGKQQVEAYGGGARGRDPRGEDAPQAQNGAGSGYLHDAQGDRRARLRPNQRAARLAQVLLPRAGSGVDGVGPDLLGPQPAQALPGRSASAARQ